MQKHLQCLSTLKFESKVQNQETTNKKEKMRQYQKSILCIKHSPPHAAVDFVYIF